MKIAVVGTKGLPVKQGGIERYCAELYPSLVAQGHSIDLYARSSYTNTPWFSYSDFNGVRVISIPSPEIKGLEAFINCAIALIVCIYKGYDIIHFHALGPALFSRLAQIFSSAKIVVTCQGLDWQRAKWNKLFSSVIRQGEKIAARHADEIVVVSKVLHSYFLETYGRDTLYIPNGPGRYPDSDPKFSYGKSLGLEQGRYVIFLGRLVPEKNPDLLLRAFNQLKPEGWKLVIAGGASDAPKYMPVLQRLASENKNVLLVGELHGSRLAEIVRGSGLFVLPSDLEGLPLVMLEAMLEGIPVLGSNIPPHQQLLSDGRGLMFKAGDLDSCVQGLEEAISQPVELAQRAKEAQMYVEEHYNWEKITAENLKLYKKLCNLPEEVKTVEEVRNPVIAK
ncbi:MAG: glycosyltransferase family 4 protein [Symploca sp. SIO3E6]|nr:glycosyltransferase family 4 protein [Caldora sp. SIO3E6]